MGTSRGMLHVGLPRRATVATCSSSGDITWASSFHLPHPDAAVEDLIKGHWGSIEIVCQIEGELLHHDEVICRPERVSSGERALL